MKSRYVIKVAGAAGQGIKTSGLVLAKALKRAGFFSFGYTEYPSLIRGGHNVFQIDIADRPFASVTKSLNVLLALNQESVSIHKDELCEHGVLIYDEGAFSLSEELSTFFDQKNIEIFPLELLKLAKGIGGTALMKNVVSLGAIWKIFNLDLNTLHDVIAQIFKKNPEMVELNKKAAEAGYTNITKEHDYFQTNFIPKPEFADNLIISGNEAIGMGAIAAGVRLYTAYPMTPSSAILSYVAKEGPKFGMVVKQAEDEITATNMVIGANIAGTRAMTSTSGGGFDLMSESVSLAGITETPLVIVLGQRPGPATGVPTWTTQGDLNLAIFAGHGEYPKMVIAPSDATDAFQMTKIAHNMAEKYQIPVIILTDKFMAESFFSNDPFDLNAVGVDRGKLVKADDLVNFQDKLRYTITDDGVSPRWLPGDQAAPFLVNSDEHDERGFSTEEADQIQDMMNKRMRKVKTIYNDLPDPKIFGEQSNPDVTILSWGSNRTTILDAFDELSESRIKFSLIHYEYLWPLKTEKAAELISNSKYVCSIEVNFESQLTNLFRRETGIDIHDKLVKFDGRPFYLEELVSYFQNIITKLK